MKLTLIVFGAAMLGYLIPEFLAAIVKHSQSFAFNLYCMVAAGVFAAGLAL